MRFLTLAIALLLIGFNAYPQGQQKPYMEWVNTWYANGQVQFEDVAVDTDGNYYVLHRSGQQFFDFPIDADDKVLAKFNSNGALLWAETVYDSSEVAGSMGIHIDSEGLILNLRTEIKRVSLNGGVTGSLVLPQDWHIYDCDLDSEGNVYCIGESFSACCGITFGDTTLEGTGLLILKIDENLEPVWARKSIDQPGINDHERLGISIDGQNNVNLVWLTSANGLTGDGMFFLGGEVQELRDNPLVLAKIDTAANLLNVVSKPCGWGNYLWNNSFNLGDVDGLARIDSDESGNVFIYGNITDLSTFPSGLFLIDGIVFDYLQTAFVLKYNNQLDLVWNHKIKGVAADLEGLDMLYDGGQIVVSGSVENYGSNPSATAFNGDTISGKAGFYVASLDTLSGELNWVKTPQVGDSINLTNDFPIAFNHAENSVYFAATNTLNPPGSIAPGTIDGLILPQTGQLNYHPVFGKISFMNSRISGKVYQDYDLDHELDTGEPLLDGQIIQLTADDGSTKYRTTTVNGEYYFAIEDSGTYVVSYNPPTNFIETGGITSVVLIGLNDSLVTDVNFGVGYTDTVVDIEANITAFSEVTGEAGATETEFNVWTSAINVGNVTTNYSTVLGTDILTAVNVSNQADSVLQPGQVLTDNNVLTHGPIIPGTLSTATVSTVVISNTSLGSEIAIQDNQDSVEVDIVNPSNVTPCCPYDPNDKTVFGAYCEANYAEIGDTLEYRIRFMNTGTAPANTVILIDTLDASVLDLRTFRVIGHSHPMYWDISGPGKLTITYPDINLPDSSVSFLGSQGFFKFRIVMRDTVSNLTQSGSSAFIYFDNEAPIETNEPIIIAVDSIPVSELTATDAICGGESGLIDASISFGIGADSAYWGNGSTGLPLPYNDEGTYTVELVDEYGCRYLDSIAVSCNILTSIEENGEEFSVYPNPSNGKYYVNAKGNVRVFDVSGKELYRTSSFNAPTEIDLSALPSGIYTIQLTNKGGVFTGKVVRE